MDLLIKMEGCLNFRDLGGIERDGVPPTRSNRLFRSDCLSKLTDNDIELMKRLGIGFVIDLRSENETQTSGYPLHLHRKFDYVNIPLSDDLHSDNIFDALPREMKELYIDIVDEFGGGLAKAFKLIAARAPGTGIVFHCTAGKDRTGVTAALLLMLNGVSDDGIIANYSSSYEYMKPYFEKMIAPFIKMGLKVPEHVFRSDPESMRDFLDYFYGKYGSAEEYFLGKGLTREEIEVLKSLL